MFSKDVSESNNKTTKVRTNKVLLLFLGMAYSFRQSGYGIGVLLLIVVCVVTDYSLILLMTAAETLGVVTFQDLMMETFGKPGFIIQSIFQFLYPFISKDSFLLS